MKGFKLVTKTAGCGRKLGKDMEFERRTYSLFVENSLPLEMLEEMTNT